MTALSSMSCPSALCFAYPRNGGVLVSTSPTGGQKAWSAAAIDPLATINGIGCRPGTTTCVAVDSGGNVLIAR